MLTKLTYLLLLGCPYLCISQNPSDPVVWDMDFTKQFTAQIIRKIPTLDPDQINTYSSKSVREQNRQIMAEVDRYVEQQKVNRDRVNSIIDEAIATRPIIYYERKGTNRSGRDRFFEAFDQIAEMLTDSSKLNLTKAVYLTEAAYDQSIQWDSFRKPLQSMVTHVGYKLEYEEVSPDDKVARNMALLSFFTDTLTLEYPDRELPVTSYPMLYDFD
ncbi:MAG: hypothetical protein ABJP45_19510, partial [Cyclobacteriaceae bacterium]